MQLIELGILQVFLFHNKIIEHLIQNLLVYFSCVIQSFLMVFFFDILLISFLCKAYEFVELLILFQLRRKSIHLEKLFLLTLRKTLKDILIYIFIPNQFQYKKKKFYLLRGIVLQTFFCQGRIQSYYIFFFDVKKWVRDKFSR